MLDKMKIQALADNLRTTARRHIHQLTGEHIIPVNAVDGMLNDIIKTLHLEMLEDRNHCLALLEMLSLQFGAE